MSVNLEITAPSHVPSNEELVEQVERILRSQQLSGSEVLRSLLSFLCNFALESRSEPLRVREIATAVFGRSENFDSQTDSVVRVHTGRLRSKLAEYYMSEGSDDDLVVTIPKGSYALHCHYRPNGAPSSSLSTITGSPAPISGSVCADATATRPQRAPNHSISIVLTGLLLLLAVATTWLVSAIARHREAVPTSIRTFWGGFATSEPSPLIVFSNFRFIASPDGGLKDYGGPNGPDKSVIDTYTTMGEVMGVFETSRVLSLLHQAPRVKRGRLLTWDEARDSNLIFIGGPLAQTPLRDVSILKDFRFDPGTATSSGALANLHPKSGERLLYVGPGPYPAIHTKRSKFDYAIVALRPGLTPNHRILVLAGITEYGTQGAAEFVARPEHLEELLTALRVKPGENMPWFEAVLRIQIQDDVPIQSKIVIAHKEEN